MAVVTIARQEGAWGAEVAAKLAVRLSAQLVDQQLLELAAAHSGVPVEVLAAMDERGRSLWRHPSDLWRTVPVPLTSLSRTTPGAIHAAQAGHLPDVEHAEHHGESETRYPPTGPVATHALDVRPTAYWATEHYQQLIGETIRTVADQAGRGHVVIVGRGGQCALGPAAGTVHALIVAPFDLRVARVCRATGADSRSAAARVRRYDRDRKAFHRQMGGVSWLDPTLYDYVINTERVSADLAADLLSAAAHAAPPYQPDAALMSAADPAAH